MGTTGFEQRIPTWTMGDRLAKARRDTGMSTREFADALGVSATTAIYTQVLDEAAAAAVVAIPGAE